MSTLSLALATDSDPPGSVVERCLEHGLYAETRPSEILNNSTRVYYVADPEGEVKITETLTANSTGLLFEQNKKISTLEVKSDGSVILDGALVEFHRRVIASPDSTIVPRRVSTWQYSATPLPGVGFPSPFCRRRGDQLGHPLPVRPLHRRGRHLFLRLFLFLRRMEAGPHAEGRRRSGGGDADRHFLSRPLVLSILTF